MDARVKPAHDEWMDTKPYRPNVGIALFNAQGRVLIGHRFKHDGPEYILPGFEWQMPQGGVDPNEDPRPAPQRASAPGPQAEVWRGHGCPLVGFSREGRRLAHLRFSALRRPAAPARGV